MWIVSGFCLYFYFNSLSCFDLGFANSRWIGLILIVLFAIVAQLCDLIILIKSAQVEDDVAGWNFLGQDEGFAKRGFVTFWNRALLFCFKCHQYRNATMVNVSLESIKWQTEWYDLSISMAIDIEQCKTISNINPGSLSDLDKCRKWEIIYSIPCSTFVCSCIIQFGSLDVVLVCLALLCSPIAFHLPIQKLDN